MEASPLCCTGAPTKINPALFLPLQYRYDLMRLNFLFTLNSNVFSPANTIFKFMSKSFAKKNGGVGTLLKSCGNAVVIFGVRCMNYCGEKSISELRGVGSWERRAHAFPQEMTPERHSILGRNQTSSQNHQTGSTIAKSDQRRQQRKPYT